MARTLPRDPGPTVPTPPTVPPPGGGFPQKPGLDGKGDQQDPKKGGRTHRRNLASPCDRPPATPQNVQMNFHVTEAKTHLNYHARITWDDVDTDTSGFHINTVDRWEVQWRALDSDGDPVQEEHAGLTSATNPTGDTYRFNLSHGVTWVVGDRVKVKGCFPQTDYNGTWTIINKIDPNTIEVKGQQTGLQNANRTGEIFNLSTDQHYNRKLRNPVAKIALKSAKMIVTTPGNKNIASIKNVGGQIWRVQVTSAAAPHGFTKQDFVKITGASPAAYNGTWNVRNIIDNDEFEVTGDTAGLANSTSGTVSGAETQFEYKTRGDNGFNVGQRIKVENCRPEVAYNGNWTVTATPGTDTFRVSSNRAPNNPLNDAEVPGRVLDQEDNLHVLTNHIPRPKTWSWEARVRCRSGEGCWSDYSPWTAPQLPYQDADPQPPIPTFGATPISFDNKGKRKHDKLRMTFTFNEVTDWDVPGGDRESDMEGYDVRVDTSKDQGATWDGPEYRIHKFPAKADSDADTTVTAVFHRIARHLRYRCAVRSRDRFGRRSDWSVWTPSALPFDDIGPPAPKNVTRFALHDRVRIEWDEPTINFETRGTVSGSSGGSTLTGINTKFVREVGSGSTILVNGTQYLVKRVSSDTSLTIVGTLIGGVSAKTLFLVEEDPDVAGYEAQIADAVDVTIGTLPDDWNNVFRSHRGTANGHTFRIPNGQEEHQWYLRARSFDAARNKSDWIYATSGPNSDPNTDGELIQLIRDVTQVTFVSSYVENPDPLPGGGNQAHNDLQKGQLEGMWLADRDYRFLNIRSSIGNHDPSTHPNDGTPTGQPIHMNVRRIRDYGLPTEVDDYVIDQGGTAPEKLQIGAGNHGDSVNPGTAQFVVPNVYAGEYLYGNVTQTGGPQRPGKHLRITCTLVPLQF